MSYKDCLAAVEGFLWFQFSSNSSNKLAFLSTRPMSNSAHQDKENLLSIIKYLLGLRYIPAAKIFTNGSLTYRTFHKKPKSNWNVQLCESVCPAVCPTTSPSSTIHIQPTHNNLKNANIRTPAQKSAVLTPINVSQ